MKRFFLLCVFVATAAGAQSLLQPQQAFEARARFLDDKRIEVRYDIASGYYLYRDKFAFSTDSKNFSLGKVALPHGVVQEDEYFGRVEIFRDSVLIVLPFTRKGGAETEPITLNARSQGCAEIGVCFPPFVQVLTVRPASN
ncbi:MAG TPA: protein-disulfide reductase DsbD N-terminal domain-containing protein [Burkholderiales bacterium]|jgi:thioredoxin:protein disulfide reductase|nr:protein-disulfide reductase DsbD N-terminal domain-containing protein [Burkholderiales bacterium]